MSIAWPTDLVAYRCDCYLQNNTGQFVSALTRSQQVLRRAGARWVLTASFHFGRDKAQRMDALLAKLKGAYEAAAIWDFARTSPINGTPEDLSSIADTHFTDGYDFSDGTWFGAGPAGLTIYGGWPIGAETVLLLGFPQYQTGLKAGDYIGLAGKLYMLIADATADGLNRATLYLNRGLIAALAHEDVPMLTRPTADLSLVDDAQPNRSIAAGGIYEYTLSFVEDL